MPRHTLLDGHAECVRLRELNAELLERLSDLCDRAERARALLQRDGGFWGMLDTTRERAVIAKARQEATT